MTPDQIFELFMTNWSGTQEELTSALFEYYKDIQSSYDLAMLPDSSERRKLVHDEVDDYWSNHYGE